MDTVKTRSRTHTTSTWQHGMGRMFASGLILATLTSLGGCRICATCDENAYAAFGGSWQRTNRDCGRVGSLFDPAGGLADGLVSRDTPAKPDALQRARQDKLEKRDSDGDRAEEEGIERRKREDQQERRGDDLRQRKLDDIQEEKENELRQRELDDINIHIFPGQPLPPLLR